MAMSPLGNIIHVNQNMQIQTLMQAGLQNRIDFQSFMNMEEFNDKLEKIEEVRPTEEVGKIDEEGHDSSQDQQGKEKREREDEEDEEDEGGVKVSNHILDITV